MRTLLLVMFATAAALPAFAADPAEGCWKSFDEEAATRASAYGKV